MIRSNGRTHYFAIGFAISLLILAAVLFSTFAFGAYMVFNAPTSNVIAATKTSANGTSYLTVNATSLNDSSSAVIWMDPNVNFGSDGYPSSIYQNSGVKIGSASTDSRGNLYAVLPLTGNTLQKISNDGLSIHYLWILIINDSSTSQNQLPVSPFSAENYSTATERTGITFFVTLYTFVLPITFNLGSLFLVLWTAYLILFAMALNGPIKNVIRAMKDASSFGLSAVFDNSMLGMVAAFPLVLWSSVLLALLQQSVGVSTGNLPPTDPLLLFVELSIAPIREEIGFRLVPIGIGAFALLIARGRIRDSILSLWHPSKYLKKNLTPQQYKRALTPMYVLGGISAFLFGLAHYVLGAGWGPGKITEAAIAGVALAALYYKYGLPATILLHWAVDYALTSYELIPSLLVPYELVIIYTLLVAVAVTGVLLVLFYRKVQNRKGPIQIPVQS